MSDIIVEVQDQVTVVEIQNQTTVEIQKNIIEVFTGGVPVGLFGSIEINGSFAYKLITVTAASVTAGNEVVILCDATSNNITVNLPAALAVKNRIYFLKKINTINTVTVDPNGTEAIDGDLTQVLSLRYETLKIISDGSNWFII